MCDSGAENWCRESGLLEEPVIPKTVQEREVTPQQSIARLHKDPLPGFLGMKKTGFPADRGLAARPLSMVLFCPGGRNSEASSTLLLRKIWKCLDRAGKLREEK